MIKILVKLSLSFSDIIFNVMMFQVKTVKVVQVKDSSS